MSNQQAIVDEAVWLFMKENLRGPVSVAFTVTDSTHSQDYAFWDENLEAEEIPLGTTDVPSGANCRIHWNVSVNKMDPAAISHDFPKAPRIIDAKVWEGHNMGTGTDHGGKAGYWILNNLKVPGFKITGIHELHLVMLHEHAISAGSASFSYDSNVLFKEKDLSGVEREYVVNVKILEDYWASLTVEQKMVLAHHDLEPFNGNRLVCFVTLKTKDQIANEGLRMCADLTGVTAATSVMPNARFGVFHLKADSSGKIVEQITLVCFTNYFVLNWRNLKTREFFDRHRDGKPPQDWLDPTNTKPYLFRIGCYVQPLDEAQRRRSELTGDFSTHGHIYNRVLNKDGVDFMQSNALHGIVNTVGCWMMFRNYNWPKSLERDFDEIYVKHFRRRLDNGRDPNTKTEIDNLIGPLGYDKVTETIVAGSVTAGNSFNKFLYEDSNYAYNWFFKWLVGVECFSEKEDDFRQANAINLHGSYIQNSCLKADVDTFAARYGSYLYYSMEDRLAADPSFSIKGNAGRNSWQDNILGFKTAQNFTGPPGPNNRRFGIDKTWADLYIYRDPGLVSTTGDAIEEMVADHKPVNDNRWNEIVYP